MTLLNVSKLTKHFGADLIFRGVTFQVARGEKVALLGANGTGKSTLLKIISGVEAADGGEVQLARDSRLAYLAQEKQFAAEQTLWQEMEDALSHLRDLQREIHSLEARLHEANGVAAEERLRHYGELTARFEHGGGYHIEQNIKRTLQGLGFTEDQFQQQLAVFSGGQKTRAALAAAILSDPDLLLLDEPTNHLDLEAMEWLDGFLKVWSGTLIVVSHDRHFLDKVTERTLELSIDGVEDYPAGYHRYLQLKADRWERRLKEYTAQQEEIARTEEFIRRYKAGQRSKEAQGREKRLDRLKEQNLLARPEDRAKLKLSLDSQSRSGEMVLGVDKLAAGYGVSDGDGGMSPLVLLEADKLELRRGERVALIGPNGCGKTTLLRTAVGELRPLRGRIRRGHNVEIGYYAQGHEALNPRATVLEEVFRIDPDLGETRARSLLGQFLFTGDDAFKRIADLSGGERSRVALVQLMLLRSNLLVMDEPTNHLDIDAREALEAVLQNYKGSILFVSHDRYLIDALADKLWIVVDGQIQEHAGNYSDYTSALEKRRRQAKFEAIKEGSHQKERPANSAKSEAARIAAAEKQRQKRLTSLEADVERLESELTALKAELEAASVAQDVTRVTALGHQFVEREAEHQRRYDEWAEMVSAIG